MNTLSIDLAGFTPDAVKRLLEYAEELRVESASSEHFDDESWRSAPYEGWTIELVELLREFFVERGDTARLRCFDLAIQQGGSISRDQVYSVCGYDPDRKLTGWTRPFDTAANLLEDEYGLPGDAPWPLWADYAEGERWKPARGFQVHPGIVRLVREQAELTAA